MSEINIYNRDCIEAIGEIEDSYFDLCFTSPPYNMNLRIRNGKYCSRQIVKEISTKYKNFPDNLPMEDYYLFLEKTVRSLIRVSKITFFNIQILTGNKPAIFKLIGEFHNKIKEVIIWDKVNAQPAIGDGVLNSQFEIILVFSDEDSMKRKFNKFQFKRGELSNLWRIKRERTNNKDHGASFPVSLASTVIKEFSDIKSHILDPFMGTGSTAIACHDMNRRFTGYEIDKNYFNTAKKRIDIHTSQGMLF